MDYRKEIKKEGLDRREVAKKLGLSYFGLARRLGEFTPWQTGEELQLMKIIEKSRLKAPHA